MKKVIAIAISDLHCNNWNKFNDNNKRTRDHFLVLKYVAEACNKHKVKHILFGGDFFHRPENIDSELLDILTQEFRDWENHGVKLMGISGNHDMKHSNRLDKPSPSLFTSLSRLVTNVECLDLTSKVIKGKYEVHGVPYLDRNLGMNEYLTSMVLDKNHKHILLLHTDYPGAKDNDGSVVDSVENLNINILNKFDLVLIGHIHKPQRLSKKVYMIGATHQQRRTDKDSELGYTLIYDDLSIKLVSLRDKFPRFIDVESAEEVKEDGNYYTVIGQNLNIKNDTEVRGIDIGLSRKKIAKQYLRKSGVKDREKKKLLLNILNEINND